MKQWWGAGSEEGLGSGWEVRLAPTREGRKRGSLRSPAPHVCLPLGTAGENAGAGKWGAAGGHIHTPSRHPHRPCHQHAVPHQRQALLLPRGQQARGCRCKCIAPTGAPNGTVLGAVKTMPALTSPLFPKGLIPHTFFSGWELPGVWVCAAFIIIVIFNNKGTPWQTCRSHNAPLRVYG